MSKPNAVYKAAERQRKEAMGLKRGEYWLPEYLHEQVKKYVKRLLKREGK